MNNSKFFGLFCTSAAILLLAGCTASKNEPSVSQSSTSTVASTSEDSEEEATVEVEDCEKSPDGDYYIEVYEKDGHVYRVDDDTMLY